MIRNTKKAFTLVELIVVITILAILGTIAFISLQGYSGDAKNSKVTSDLRNIASAIETTSTKNGTSLLSMVDATIAANAIPDTTSTFGSGTQIAIWTNYDIGNVDFAVIGQNGADFLDPNGANAKYLFAAVTSSTFKAYQLAGQIIDNDTKKARITGTYYKAVPGDTADGLIEANNKDAWNTTVGLKDDWLIWVLPANTLY